MRFRRLIIVITVITTLVLASAPLAADAQRKKKPAKPAEGEPADDLAKLKAEVVSTARDYRTSLEKVVALQEEEVAAAAEDLERRRGFLAQGIISKRELEDAERALTDAKGRLSETRRQIVECDHLIAEAQAAEQLAKLPPMQPGGYVSTLALIRYSGVSSWAISEVAKVDLFFTAQFHHSLPVSALGQTAVHDRLGFDHRDSIDVALSPDSVEGQALMSYLRSAGIPFIAFRTAVPGAATGAHIHIGYPSKRIAR